MIPRAPREANTNSSITHPMQRLLAGPANTRSTLLHLCTFQLFPSFSTRKQLTPPSKFLPNLRRLMRPGKAPKGPPVTLAALRLALPPAQLGASFRRTSRVRSASRPAPSPACRSCGRPSRPAARATRTP